MDSVPGLRLRKEADDIARKCGVRLSDLSGDDLILLVDAVKRVCSPFSACNVDLVDTPIAVTPGVFFWPPTAGAQIWLDEYAAQWWSKSSLRYKWAVCYALKNARNADAFCSLTERRKAERAIIKCALCIPLHGRELQEAINRAYGVGAASAPRLEQQSRRLQNNAMTDFAAIVARLEVKSGIGKDEWLWGKSLTYTLKAYSQMHTFAAAISGKNVSGLKDELDEALINLAAVKAKIVRRYKMEPSDEQGA